MRHESDIVEALRVMATEMGHISKGGASPSGFEALCMAIGGPGTPGNENLTQTIEDAGVNVKEGLSEVAASIHELAAAIREIKKS